MSAELMIKSDLDGYVIEIKGNSTMGGVPLVADPAAVGQSLNKPAKFSADQAWKVLSDPAGSSHHIIQNASTNLCFSISDNSTQPGAALHTGPRKDSGNANQLWDFLPDPFGSGSCFIQNPQTGFVIEIQDGSSAAGAPLVVKPRRIFANSHQLWSAVDEQFTSVAFPLLTLLPGPAGSNTGSNTQYLLLAPDQNKYLKAVIVNIDVIDDIVASNGWTVQINGTAPAPVTGQNDTLWYQQWMQYGLIAQNSSLALFCQVWHASGLDTPGDPLASVMEISQPMVQFSENIIPAGLRIILQLTIDPSNDYVTGITGEVFQNGGQVGKPVTWSVIGQPTFNAPGTVSESDLSPCGAVSVVVVGPPSENVYFSSIMGTITAICDPPVQVVNHAGPNPHGDRTAEQSNCYYGEVQQGTFGQVAIPFGVVSPRITKAGLDYVAGTGLYPNSRLKVSGNYQSVPTGPIKASFAQNLTTGPDGSFTIGVTPEMALPGEQDAELFITVTDDQGNSVTGLIIIQLFANSYAISSSTPALRGVF
jgi:hypothetical protein